MEHEKTLAQKLQKIFSTYCIFDAANEFGHLTQDLKRKETSDSVA